jgi:phosphoribosylformimino-5-aminoimidazole carboxamide ribotide isomerase
MDVIPAIDIREGKCVRLTKGVAGSETVYYENPLDAAMYWQNDMNATRLHFVDLDAAIGLGDNCDLITKIIKQVHIKVQVGGGIRDIEKAMHYINAGADRVVIGTVAIKNPTFIPTLAKKISPEHIIVSLDHKHGKVAIKGWTEITSKSAYEIAKDFEANGAGYILFSAVEADGTLSGPDIENTKKMVESVKIPVYAAGGTRNKSDIQALKEIGAYGVIIGKAFYEHHLDYRELKSL